MYQPSSSSAISVTNFGARGDGATNDIAAIRAAVDSLQSRGLGGSIYFPRATYTFSGTIDVTGQNLTFLSDGGAVIKSFPDESAKKFNLSGAKNITFKGLTLDGNRVVGVNGGNQNGFISTLNVENLEVTDCDLFNCRDSMVYLGGGTRFARVTNNHFTGHFCGVYGFINSGEYQSEGFVISDNTFGASWIPQNVDMGESACVKLQSFPGGMTAYTGTSRGHIISNNVIDSSTEMGIELWSKGRHNTIFGNTIANTWWGISLDNQEYCSVIGNTIKAAKYLGIECASVCNQITIAQNTVDGFAGASGYTRVTNAGIISSNTTCDSIVHDGNLVMGCTNGFQIQNTTNTIISNNVVRDCNTNLFYQGASLSQVYGNLFERRNAEVSYQIFFDASSVNISGFHLSHNKFRGATTNQSIFYYTNSNPARRISDLCVENNITDSSTSGGYDVFIGGQLTPTNFVYRTNFGPSGSNASNSIQDATDPTNPLPYGTTNLQAGIQYYGNLSYTIPTGGISGSGSSSGIWLCLWSGGGGYVDNVRINAIYYNNLGNNSSAGMEIWASTLPYPAGKHALMVQPQGAYGQNLFSQIRTRSDWQAWGVSMSVWAKLDPTWTGSVGAQIYSYFTQQNNAVSIYGTYAEPTWDAYGAAVYPNQHVQSLNLSDGVQISSGVSLYTTNGSDLIIDTSGSVTIPRLAINITGGVQSNVAYTTGSQNIAAGKSFGNTDFTGNLFGLTSDLPGAFRWGTRFGVIKVPGQQTKMAYCTGDYFVLGRTPDSSLTTGSTLTDTLIIDPIGQVGIGTGPSAGFHTLSSVRFAGIGGDGIVTSNSAGDLRSVSTLKSLDITGNLYGITPDVNGAFRWGTRFGIIKTIGSQTKMVYSTGDYFILSRTADSTVTTGSSLTDVLLIDPVGRVGIGTGPSAGFHTLSSVRFQGIGGAGTVTSDSNGNLSVTSDERLKDVVAPFTRGLSDLSGVSPILYHWKPESEMETTGLYAGFSAQNVAQHIPEAAPINDKGYYSLSDRPIIATLINAVNELAARVRELESRQS